MAGARQGALITGLALGAATAAYGIYQYAVLHSKLARNRVRCPANIESMFRVTRDDMKKIVAFMIDEMCKGLETAGGSDLKMIPSYVHYLPTGKETGKFLALDLGGSNFRVLTLKLDGRAGAETQSEKFVIPQAIMTGTAEALFDFIVECLEQFLVDFQLLEGHKFEKLPLGFTFSFPVDQHSLNSGTLIQWTKGFSASGAEGQDVVALLEAALRRRQLAVNVVALVNDTVGTQMARCLTDRECFVGLILGTGTNACYLEKSGRVAKTRLPASAEDVIVNIEWGDFDRKREVLPVTRYDSIVDTESVNKGQQIFEKMISGMYLGEIARLVCVDLSVEGELFGGRRSPNLEQQWAFKTAFMSEIEADPSVSLDAIDAVLWENFQIHSSVHDRALVRRVCELVSTRAARLSAAGVGAVVTKAGRLHSCTVAVDGSVFQLYPHFEERMRQGLVDLFGRRDAANVRFKRSADGSGLGAAAIAAVAADHAATARAAPATQR